MDSGLAYSRLPATPVLQVPQVPQTARTPRVPARSLPPRANPQAVLAAIALGAVAAVGLWFYDTPSVSGLAGWLNGAGRILGLLAGYSVVVLVALMARIPALEHGLGADRLARWHAMGGRYTVSLVVAHAVLITWGYAVGAHTSVIHQEWTLLRSYPDVLAATVAGLLLVGVGISSARAARRRLRYETWYYLHFYTYLAIALAFSHQFAVGEDFMFNAAARAVWAAFYLVVGAALVWYRIVVPLRQARRHRMRVASVVVESPDAVSLVVTGQHLDELAAQPGQFFRWRFLSRELWWASNPYSLSAPVGPNVMRITAKNLGNHSQALSQLRPGTRVYAEGPYGTFTARRRTQRRVLLIGAGVGITPLRSLFETIYAWPGDLALIYRESDPRKVLFRHELEAIAAKRNALLAIIVGSRAQLGYDPLSAASLGRIPAIREHDVYLCGPEEMQQGVSKALRSLGVPRRHIHVESFTF